jgi:ornithine cyclodeaminase
MPSKVTMLWHFMINFLPFCWRKRESNCFGKTLGVSSMTRFVDIHALSRLVQALGATTFIEELVQTLREDFQRWPAFDKSARLASHSPLGVIELMPVSDGQHYAFKYVNGHPANTARGLFTVMAFGVLADVETGYPLLLSELTLTTAFRTAATSVMAAMALARPGSRSMALIGNGAQSEFQALAFHHMMGIEELRVFDVDNRASEKLKRNLAPFSSLKVTTVASVQEAVQGADIVTTVTADKSRAAVLTPDMIEPGMHINAVGGDCPGKTELHPDVLRGAQVFVEFEPQTRIEGDIQQLPADFPVVELWRVLTGQARGRDDAKKVTVFDSVGFALEDFSALRYIYRKVRELSMGMETDLIPPTDDPKDLFRHTRRSVARAKLRRAA